MSLSLLSWRRRMHDLYARVRELDPPAGHRLWQRERDELFARHQDSPLLPADRSEFRGLPVGDYDAAFRFEVTLERDIEPRRLEAPTGTDGLVVFQRIGVLLLPGLGTLDAWWLASYGGGLFVPVKDSLAGTRTYGGGRYLIDTVKGADLGGRLDRNELVVDLNFAYNPSCAYDPAWACPLAPPGNTLAIPLPVGELV
jgi:hypothetical protein